MKSLYVAAALVELNSDGDWGLGVGGSLKNQPVVIALEL